VNLVLAALLPHGSFHPDDSMTISSCSSNFATTPPSSVALSILVQAAGAGFTLRAARNCAPGRCTVRFPRCATLPRPSCSITAPFWNAHLHPNREARSLSCANTADAKICRHICGALFRPAQSGLSDLLRCLYAPAQKQYDVRGRPSAACDKSNATRFLRSCRRPVEALGRAKRAIVCNKAPT
jgi:hypothetical protein